MDRITYIPRAQPPFPPRAFNPASISPGHPGHLAPWRGRGSGRERERERERDREREREKDREKEQEREHREREREREHRERERMAAASEYMRAGPEQPGRPSSHGYMRSPSPSVRSQEGVVQQRPSIFQGTNSKSVITPLMQMPPASVAQTGARYSTAADALAALVDVATSAPQMDVAKAKEAKQEALRAEERQQQQQHLHQHLHQQEERERERERDRISLQSSYASMSLPGGKPHPAYGEGSKDKGPPTKLRIEQELRAHGKTTITAANFIDVIITRQIASDKESRERGSQSSDSSSSSSAQPGTEIFNLPAVTSSSSMQFPYNPLTMRMLSSTPPSMPCASPSLPAQQGGAAPRAGV